MSIFSEKSQPLLVNNVNRIKPLINTMPQLSALNLNQTLNTEVVCRVCRGKELYILEIKKSVQFKYHIVFIAMVQES